MDHEWGRGDRTRLPTEKGTQPATGWGSKPKSLSFQGKRGAQNLGGYSMVRGTRGCRRCKKKTLNTSCRCQIRRKKKVGGYLGTMSYKKNTYQEGKKRGGFDQVKRRNPNLSEKNNGKSRLRGRWKFGTKKSPAMLY